jgi:hypothetical protein
MSAPLRNARHEAFALHIANGHKLERAHELAGFRPDRKTAWSLRHRPDISRRVDELLKERVRADTQRRFRREKKEEALRDRVIAELERIAFADVRDVVSWQREPVLSADGEVLELTDRVSVVPSNRLSADAAASIKNVFTKSGQVRVEMHDKQAALLALAKHLQLFDEQSAPTTVVNQLNVGAVNSIDMAQRVLFMLNAAASQRAPAAEPITTIEAAANDRKS